MAAHSTRPRVERTQVLRLGTLAERTASVSALLDYVQVQTGKRAEWRQEEFGPRLLRALTDLQGRAEGLAAEAAAQGIRNDDLARTLHLELARQFIRHLLAAYVAGPSVQGHAQRPGEGARLPGPARGAPPDRRPPPGPQAPPQARRPVGDRPPRPEQPAPAGHPRLLSTRRARSRRKPARQGASPSRRQTRYRATRGPALHGARRHRTNRRQWSNHPRRWPRPSPSMRDRGSPPPALPLRPRTTWAPANAPRRTTLAWALLPSIARAWVNKRPSLRPRRCPRPSRRQLKDPEGATFPPAPHPQGRRAVEADDVVPTPAGEGIRREVPGDEATEEHPGAERL